MFPLLAMNHTKFPNACKALMAFMLEADQFNKWMAAAEGYLSHCLNAYDANPVWTADPKRTPYRDVAKRSLTAGGLGSVGEKAAAAIADFIIVDMFASYVTGREEAPAAIRIAERQFSAFIADFGTDSYGRAFPASIRQPQPPRAQSASPVPGVDLARTQRGSAQGVNRGWLTGLRPAAVFLICFWPSPYLGMVRSPTRIGRVGQFVGLENYSGCGRNSHSGCRYSTRCSTPASPAWRKFAVGLYQRSRGKNLRSRRCYGHRAHSVHRSDRARRSLSGWLTIPISSYPGRCGVGPDHPISTSPAMSGRAGQ